MIPIIYSVSKSVGVCAAILHSICAIESGGRNVTSPHDGGSPSYGVCQIKLGTARLFNPSVKASDLKDPYTNAYYAAMYLKKQQDRYNSEWKCIIASYNAGSCFKKRNGKIANAQYVKKVQKKYNDDYRKGILYNQINCPRLI